MMVLTDSYLPERRRQLRLPPLRQAPLAQLGRIMFAENELKRCHPELEAGFFDGWYVKTLPLL